MTDRKNIYMRAAMVVALTGLLFPLTALSAEEPAFEDRLGAVIEQLDTDVEADAGFSGVLASLLVAEYGIPRAEFEWAVGESVSWGRIAVLSYMEAATGRDFEELASSKAHVEIESYVTRKELSPDRMLDSLENLARKAVRERNSRIFDRLRGARHSSVLPDLGAGFGLFQEALDFRQVGPPSPVKIHSGPGFLGKTDGGK